MQEAVRIDVNAPGHDVRRDRQRGRAAPGPGLHTALAVALTRARVAEQENVTHDSGSVTRDSRSPVMSRT